MPTRHIPALADLSAARAAARPILVTTDALRDDDLRTRDDIIRRVVAL